MMVGMHLPLPPPPPPIIIDIQGPRGVSNQPAWMTQQPPPQPAVVNNKNNNEPPMKRMKVDVTDPKLVFPNISPEKVTTLRQYISTQIQHYLGEAEETLIAFVLDRIVANNNNSNNNSSSGVAALLPELTEVFDDDAVAFLQSIYEYSQQLSVSTA